MIKDDLLRLLVNLLLFTKNDISLTFDGGLLEFRVLEDVGEDIDCRWDVRVE